MVFIPVSCRKVFVLISEHIISLNSSFSSRILLVIHSLKRVNGVDSMSWKKTSWQKGILWQTDKQVGDYISKTKQQNTIFPPDNILGGEQKCVYNVITLKWTHEFVFLLYSFLLLYHVYLNKTLFKPNEPRKTVWKPSPFKHQQWTMLTE